MGREGVHRSGEYVLSRIVDGRLSPGVKCARTPVTFRVCAREESPCWRPPSFARARGKIRLQPQVRRDDGRVEIRVPDSNRNAEGIRLHGARNSLSALRGGQQSGAIQRLVRI